MVRMDVKEAARKAIGILPACSFPGNTEWTYDEIPLSRLVSEAMKDRFAKHWGTFESFHEAFVRSEGVPLWARRNPNSKWAIVLTGPPGGPYRKKRVIADGWHRLNFYVDRYGADELIPVVWPSS